MGGTVKLLRYSSSGQRYVDGTRNVKPLDSAKLFDKGTRYPDLSAAHDAVLDGSVAYLENVPTQYKAKSVRRTRWASSKRMSSRPRAR